MLGPAGASWLTFQPYLAMPALAAMQGTPPQAATASEKLVDDNSRRMFRFGH